MKLKKMKKYMGKKKNRKKFVKKLPWLVPIVVFLLTLIVVHKHPKDDYDGDLPF